MSIKQRNLGEDIETRYPNKGFYRTNKKGFIVWLNLDTQTKEWRDKFYKRIETEKQNRSNKCELIKQQLKSLNSIKELAEKQIDNLNEELLKIDNSYGKFLNHTGEQLNKEEEEERMNRINDRRKRKKLERKERKNYN